MVSVHPVRLRDGRWRYLDGAFPGTGHGFEADSYDHHSTQPDWERDHTRNLELMEEGWVVIPITPRMLERDPEKVLCMIAHILEKAGVWPRPPAPVN